MQRAPHSRRQRAELRALARHIRRTDPQLARMLSSREGYVLPPIRLTSLPTAGYLAAAAVLLVVGIILGVGSAILCGLACLALAALRHRARPDAGDADVRRSSGHDPRTGRTGPAG